MSYVQNAEMANSLADIIMLKPVRLMSVSREDGKKQPDARIGSDVRLMATIVPCVRGKRAWNLQLRS
ncbi:hypothetical protein ACJ72_03382, partial [Emergomyces africanus]